MKKLLALCVTAAMLAAMLCGAAAASGEPEAEFSLAALEGSYGELFPEFAREEYRDFWLACIDEFVGDAETDEVFCDLLISSCMGTLKGAEAVEAYAEAPEAVQFDCYFENGIAVVTIEGDTISGTDADGAELFRNTYEYVGDEPIVYMGEPVGMTLHVFRAVEEDAGDYTFFAFTDDVPAETQHIEFRYGASEEGLYDYSEGDYAYWLCAGIPQGYEDSFIQDCIALFVSENMAELFAEDAA